MEWDLIPTPSPEPPDDGGESRSRMLEDVIDAVAAMGADPVYNSDPYKPSRADENRRNLQYASPSPYPMPSPGPYGYDGSACEKLFAHLKVGDLNPDDIQSGKR